jgi:hypothetical protein
MRATSVTDPFRASNKPINQANRALPLHESARYGGRNILSGENDLALPPSTEDTFVREVDEELRRDELLGFWQRYGRWLIAGVASLLAAYAGYLWWSNRVVAQNGALGEAYDKALVSSIEGKKIEAEKGLNVLGTGENSGYRASAIAAKAAMAIEQKNYKEAARLYGTIASDGSVEQPWRDLALIRQTHIELETMKPQDVIARLTPLAVKGNAFFGSAGEMVAISYMKLGKKAEAGKIFGAIYKDETVPESLRSRAVKMAGVLGVDVVEATSEVKSK